MPTRRRPVPRAWDIDSDSDLDDEYMSSIALIHAALTIIVANRVLWPATGVKKRGQLSLVLANFRLHDPLCFRRNLRVSPATFDALVTRIQNHSIFETNGLGLTRQFPVAWQLAIALYRFGHYGNAASVEAVAQWAGISAGSVVKCTRRVIVACNSLHDEVVRWPTADDKEEAKQWVESVSCPAWRDGFCMVDGTLVKLAEKPGHHGEAYFDRKSNYSLNVQVRTCMPRLLFRKCAQ